MINTMIKQNGISHIDATIFCDRVDAIVMTSTTLLGFMPKSSGTF